MRIFANLNCQFSFLRLQVSINLRNLTYFYTYNTQLCQKLHITSALKHTFLLAPLQLFATRTDGKPTSNTVLSPGSFIFWSAHHQISRDVLYERPLSSCLESTLTRKKYFFTRLWRKIEMFFQDELPKELLMPVADCTRIIFTYIFVFGWWWVDTPRRDRNLRISQSETFIGKHNKSITQIVQRKTVTG